VAAAMTKARRVLPMTEPIDMAQTIGAAG
jgi:hypothetical protein